MLSIVDGELVEEARRYELRFTCESCAHFDPERALCGNGYPTEPHRGIELEKVRQLAFCKDFELT